MATPIPTNHAAFRVRELVEATGGTLVRGEPEREVLGVAIDSRAVVSGGVFIAIRGATHDGAAYLPQVVGSGVGAVLVHPGVSVAEGPAVLEVADTTYALGQLARYHRRRWAGQVVAITGSAGKTTTKELTAGAYAGLGRRVLKTHGNLNNYYGVPMTVLCLSAEHEVAVLEVGTSARGEIARLGEIVEPNVAIVLLAAVAHTAGIGSIEDVAEEKTSLFRALGSQGIAVVNADDPNLMARRRSDVRTISFGSREGADVRLVSSQLDVTGTRAHVVAGGVELDLSMKLVGHAAAFDSAAALAAVLASDGPSALDRAARGIEAVEPTAGRMVMRPGVAGTHVIDDTYNANPKSVALGLETLAELARTRGARCIAVLGDMKDLGPLSQREHASIGELAVRLGIDALVAAGPEMAYATAAAARTAAGRLAPHPTRVAHVLDPLDAASVVKSLMRAGDVVLVKGSRSMAMERVVDALVAGEGP